SLCEAEEKQHRVFERSEFRGCPKRAAKASRRGATQAKGWQLLWSPTGLRPWHPPHASSGATLRSVSSFAKATEDTLLAIIHGFTPVAFREGG
ncbi:MAG: hypothetical protein V3T60_11750, partial [Candidatus Binatia bacterium]